MGRVAVVTDTTHYMPRELVAQHGLHEVSLYVTLDGRTERESDITDLGEFYDRLRASNEMPTTSQPSLGDFLAVYEPLLEEGADIVSVHLSAGLSGTCQTAEQARGQLAERGIDPERIVVLDSATTCAGLAIVAMSAAGAATAGADVAQAAEAARAARAQLKIWFALETLEYLRRGGRIGGAQALLGSALKLKPILSIESEVLPVDRVRTWGRAFERLVGYLQARRDDGCDAWIVQHIQAPDQVERIVARGVEIFGSEPEYVSEVGPVLGAHAGPGMLGVAGVPGRLLRGERTAGRGG
ncbi:MAG TPA: DegV family protein [Solirubrobacteraceae bacterium]|nr:DegV family protein [Solirubrobacteraceae bacterium]